MFCRDCGILLDSEPQVTWKARKEHEPRASRPAPAPAVPARPANNLQEQDVDLVLNLLGKMVRKHVQKSGQISESQVKSFLEDSVDLVVDYPSP